MSGHSFPHPLAGQKVTVKLRGHNGVHDEQDVEYRIEDWWDRVSGGSWMFAAGNPACLKYAIRSGLVADLPLDDEVVYGHIGGFGELVHVSEIAS